MNAKNLLEIQALFETRRETLATSKTILDPTLVVATEDLADETDLATTELGTRITMRLRDRETTLIRKIDESLAKIRDGTYGTCADCGDQIEERRLAVRPTAHLCLSCKEDQEHREHSFTKKSA